MIPQLIMGVPPRRAPNLEDAGADLVETWRDAHGAIVAYSATIDSQHWMEMPGLAHFCFEATGAVSAYAHASTDPERVRDVYRRAVLPMVLQARGMEVLHASAVWSSCGVVTFCAESGTGKSTLATGLGGRGYPLWADDAVVVDPSGAQVMTAWLPCELRLRPPSAVFFRRERPAAPHAGCGVPKTRQEPVAAVCVLRRTDRIVRAVEVERLPPSAALPAVLAHGYCFSTHEPARKGRMLKQYASLVAKVPVFEIRIETGLERLPAVLDGIDTWMTLDWSA